MRITVIRIVFRGDAPASQYDKSRPCRLFGGCAPLATKYGDGRRLSRPCQFANWLARGRLRQQSSGLD